MAANCLRNYYASVNCSSYFCFFGRIFDDWKNGDSFQEMGRHVFFDPIGSVAVFLIFSSILIGWNDGSLSLFLFWSYQGAYATF